MLHGDFVSDGAFATSYDACVGTVAYGGRSFDLASVDCTGAFAAQQRLDRLDAAARTALAATSSPFVATTGGLYLGGETPGPASTAADAERLTPVHLGDGGAAGTLRALDRAIGWVSDPRAHVGAMGNRFASRVQRLAVAGRNAAAAESRIRDADGAAEVAALTRGQVLVQAATAVLNQAPSSVLTLLR